ncbi:VOC family protein [Amycolatopsis sp. GM8]|uniref:VOC family protein n=1 Tax=Amycolatopsis sp. GM8 TaxID=2896530 RepID=UPI001F1899C2|nr:VOC family protein [Amycolatopsis sp. GM8]
MPAISAPLHHVGLVVRDIETIARGYAELFDINIWHIAHTEPLLTRAVVRGERTTFGGRVAVGTAPWGSTFWLIEPAEGRSTYKDFQATNGQGIHHLAFTMDDAAADGAIAALASLNAPVAQEYDLDGVGSVVEVDTRSLLGGFYIQIIRPLAGGTVTLPADEELDLAGTYARPAGVGPLPVPNGIQHFGVVVRDMVARTESYTRVFGVPEWSVQNWRTEEGSLENPTFDGRPVEHEYFAATTPFDSALGFEIVQPTLGPSDYKENFLNVVGEGIHHLNLVGLAGHEHWLTLRSWLTATGVDVCMSGTLGGGIAEFYYLDTRKRLGGLAVECFGLDPSVDLTTMEGKGPYYRIGSAVFDGQEA